MNERQRFLATMRYEATDRAPLLDIGFWPECFDVWRQQGLPDWVSATNTDTYFGTDGFWRHYLSPEATDGHALVDRGMVVPQGLRIGLEPMFDCDVLEDLGDEEVVQLGDGTRVQRHKTMSSIPKSAGHLLTDRASWEKHYKSRLLPDSPARYPSNWRAIDELAQAEDRAHTLILPAGSLYGWIRNWMGLEGVSFLIYDDPVLFEEIVETVAQNILGVLERVLRRGGQYDACMIWEDMSYNRGPMISPQHVREFLMPRYRRITDLLRRFGVDIVIIDSDGQTDKLIPLWLEAGINCILPFEIGTTDADPLAYRKQFGRDLRIIGGVDKRILASSPEAIEAELDRLTPLVVDGGFIPTCDHKVPPDVSLDNYQYFLDRMRAKWTWV